MKCVITGGSGFTGSYLIPELLKRDTEIYNFDLVPFTKELKTDKYHYIQGDIRDFNSLMKLPHDSIDFVCHLAARQFAGEVPFRNREEWFFDVNVNGTRNVLEYMEHSNIHNLIFFSTDMTYGIPISCPVSPDATQNPLGPYGKGKVEAEKLIRSQNNLNATIFRPRLITGAGRLGILEKLFKLIKHNLPVPMIGDGSNRYQMVSVEDCVKAAILAIEHNFPNRAFNLGSATPPTTKELLKGIINHANSKSLLIPCPALPIKMTLKALDSVGLTLLYPEQFGIADQDVLLDTNETKKVLGWEPSKGDIIAMCEAYDAF